MTNSTDLMWPSPEIRDLTARLLAVQPSVPPSPGALVDGQPLLCLAACAAEAGFLARGEVEEARAFRDRAARSSDKAVLHAAFDQLGWPREACEVKLLFNDGQLPTMRKQHILEALERT